MKISRFTLPVFNIGICFLIAAAVGLITIRLAVDFIRSIRFRLGMIPQVHEPMPLIEIFPVGDIPQPESAKILSELSVR
ncbi:MAG TPA: hypothetical protein EYM38_07405 [Dehalococcoidia bacterium]|nr:hypothetical protein [Dehalococcoidia bacterium]